MHPSRVSSAALAPQPALHCRQVLLRSSQVLQRHILGSHLPASFHSSPSLYATCSLLQVYKAHMLPCCVISSLLLQAASFYVATRDMMHGLLALLVGGMRRSFLLAVIRLSLAKRFIVKDWRHRGRTCLQLLENADTQRPRCILVTELNALLPCPSKHLQHRSNHISESYSTWDKPDMPLLHSCAVQRSNRERVGSCSIARHHADQSSGDQALDAWRRCAATPHSTSHSRPSVLHKLPCVFHRSRGAGQAGKGVVHSQIPEALMASTCPNPPLQAMLQQAAASARMMVGLAALLSLSCGCSG